MSTMTTSSSSSVKPLAWPAQDFSCSVSVPPGPCGPRPSATLAGRSFSVSAWTATFAAARSINAGLQASASFEITSTTRRTTGCFPPCSSASRRPPGRYNGPVVRQRDCTIPPHQDLYLGTKTDPTYVPAALAAWSARAGGAGDYPVGSGRIAPPYGTSPPPSIPPNSLLIFDVEVV